MAFIGDEPVRTKICIDNTCIEQVRHFNCLGRDVTYGQDRGIETVSYTHLDVYKRQVWNGYYIATHIHTERP